MEIHGKLLSEGLVDRGHEVTIISTRHPEGMEYEERNGIKLVYLKNTIFDSKRHNWKKESVKKLLELDKVSKFDILCCQDPIVSNDLILREGGRNIPIIVIMELNKILLILSELNQTISHRKGLKRLIKEFFSFLYYFFCWEIPHLRKCNAVVAVSNEIASSIKKWYFVDEEKAYTVYNGVEVNFFCPDQSQRKHIRRALAISDQEKVLLFFSFITKQKGLHLLIKALPGILEKNKSIKLLVVGEGNYLAEAKELVKQLGLDSYVVFLGYIPREKTPGYINASEIFILPTLRQEGMPFSLLEAMACGKPVIASKIGGIPSVIDDGVNGLLIPPGNISKLIEKTTFLLNNKDFTDKLADNARKKVIQNFSHEKMVEETINAFELVITRKREQG